MGYRSRIPVPVQSVGYRRSDRVRPVRPERHPATSVRTVLFRVSSGDSGTVPDTGIYVLVAKSRYIIKASFQKQLGLFYVCLFVCMSPKYFSSEERQGRRERVEQYLYRPFEFRDLLRQITFYIHFAVSHGVTAHITIRPQSGPREF